MFTRPQATHRPGSLRLLNVRGRLVSGLEADCRLQDWEGTERDGAEHDGTGRDETGEENDREREREREREKKKQRTERGASLPFV